MTPADLAARHPRLYHLTRPEAVDGIRRCGLLSTSRLLDALGIDGEARDRLERQRRPASVSMPRGGFGPVTLTDQIPLSERALAGCLDDGLTPADWLMLLNRRVFFWSDEAGLSRLLEARANRGRQVAVLVVDTRRLAEAHGEAIEISPINSGSTMRRPARRGLATFTPLGAMTFETWRRQRGRRDTIREVTVLDGVPDLASHLIEVRIRG